MRLNLKVILADRYIIEPDLTIVSPIKRTPGERVGLLPGDVIIAIMESLLII